MEKLKLYAVAGDTSGPYYHDFLIPFKYFQEYGLFDCKALFRVEPGEPEKGDIIIFQRQYAPESLILIRRLKNMGKTCIFLVDDNVWELPSTNPAVSTYKGLVLERYMACLREANAGLTSTPYLAELGRRFNKNMYVQRNLVEPTITSFAAPGRDNPDEVRIGWTGTPHHHGDILPMKPVFRHLLKKYPHVKFIFFGYFPAEFKDVFPDDRVEYYWFVKPDSFYYALANLDFDIGIAPLEDNGFNRGKTARKAQEYGILKIPSVLTPVGAYEEWTDGLNCMKPKKNTISAWVWCLEHLIDDAEKRKQLGEEGYKFVMENHDITKWIYDRATMYRQIWELVQGGKL